MEAKSLVIEREAGERRCCGPHPCGAATLASTDPSVRWCVGARCMAWRHADQIGIGPRGEKRDRDHDGMTRWMDRGRCGLVRED